MLEDQKRGSLDPVVTRHMALTWKDLEEGGNPHVFPKLLALTLEKNKRRKGGQAQPTISLGKRGKV